MSCTLEIDRFYKVSHIEDRDVLPLIKPYFLWTPIPSQTLWHLDLKRPLGIYPGNNWAQCNACRINVVNRIIYGHCMPSPSNAEYYFAIAPDEDIEKVTKSMEEWDTFLKERNINSANLFDVLSVYKLFVKDYQKLPWYNQIKKK